MSEKTMTTMPRLSVSTWSLHRTLGQPALYGPEDGIRLASPGEKKTGTFSLLDLPERLNAFGLSTVELCHFHLPTLDQGYLTELRTTLEQAHVELFSLLVDAGDITHPTHGPRDLAWITSWIAIAGQLGAKCVRVIAGKSLPTEDGITKKCSRPFSPGTPCRYVGNTGDDRELVPLAFSTCNRS